jgi:preprotein translocase subunit SecF
VSEVQEALADLSLGSLISQPVDEKGMILRFQDTSEEKHQDALARLNQLGAGEEEIESQNATSSPVDAGMTDLENVIELRYDSVGPSIGAELKSKSFSATIIVLIAIVLYIAWAFRQVSKPVASWKYGLSAIIALFHDVLITLGVFAVLGEFYNVEINTAFVAAILTVLGYSVNDTIVVFDRVRENLPRSEEDFENTVNTSVNQTITRSINTSLTTLLVLVSIIIFGGESIRSFVLALSIGVFVGTYSSIFLASPVLVMWEKFGRKS